jgi:hypothetical protein
MTSRVRECLLGMRIHLQNGFWSFKLGNLVGRGQKGVWVEPLDSGKGVLGGEEKGGGEVVIRRVFVRRISRGHALLVSPTQSAGSSTTFSAAACISCLTARAISSPRNKVRLMITAVLNSDSRAAERQLTKLPVRHHAFRSAR